VGEFIKRAITGLILVLLTIALTLKGGKPLAIFVFLISIIGIREFYNAIDNISLSIRPIGYIACILFFFNSLGYNMVSLNSIMAFVTISLLILFVLKEDIKLANISITIFSILYIPFLFQHIIYLDGNIYIWFIFITAWGTDTFAYLAGNLFGKKKLCPNLSPNKTIEGSLGGVLGSILLTILFSKYLNLPNLWGLIILSILGAIIAQFGDLTASKIKRITGIKDYGFIIPGHGGILDRFDSILFTAPLVYYFVKFFIL
jgi:phosphatidate cytidylyltransferase